MRYTVLILLAILVLSCKEGTKAKADSIKDINEFVEKYGSSEFTALGLACLNGDLSKVKELLGKGADMDYAMSDDFFIYDALHVSVSYAQADIVGYLLKQGVELDRNYSLLSMACSNPDNDVAYTIAKYLVDAGAEINGCPDSNGYPDIPLHHAVLNNNVPLAKLLVEKGADINLTNQRGETIFTIAEYCNKPMKEFITGIQKSE